MALVSFGEIPFVPMTYAADYNCGPMQAIVNRSPSWCEDGGEVLLKLESECEEFFIIIKRLDREPDFLEKHQTLLKIQNGCEISYVMFIHKKK